MVGDLSLSVDQYHSGRQQAHLPGVFEWTQAIFPNKRCAICGEEKEEEEKKSKEDEKEKQCSIDEHLRRQDKQELWRRGAGYVLSNLQGGGQLK